MCQGLFFNNSFLKKTRAKVFSCEFWEVSKNIFFHRTPLTAASDSIKYLSVKHPKRTVQTSCFATSYLLIF